MRKDIHENQPKINRSIAAPRQAAAQQGRQATVDHQQAEADDGHAGDFHGGDRLSQENDAEERGADRDEQSDEQDVHRAGHLQHPEIEDETEGAAEDADAK
jgi:hypothetical protein